MTPGQSISRPNQNKAAESLHYRSQMLKVSKQQCLRQFYKLHRKQRDKNLQIMPNPMERSTFLSSSINLQKNVQVSNGLAE